jgi:hypothetical protein
MAKSNAPEAGSENTERQTPDLVAQSSKEFYETMLKERRRLNREIPAPIAHESDSDSAWAEFESMLEIKADTNQKS